MAKLTKLQSLRNINLFLTQSYLNGSGYASTINRSKLWFCTPSAIDLIGPRFYEIMGAKSLIFCTESEHYQGLFNANEHCASFRSDLSDIEEKLLYYLQNKEERNSIIDKAHEHFLKNHTWENRIDSIKNKL